MEDLRKVELNHVFICPIDRSWVKDGEKNEHFHSYSTIHLYCFTFTTLAIRSSSLMLMVAFLSFIDIYNMLVFFSACKVMKVCMMDTNHTVSSRDSGN